MLKETKQPRKLKVIQCFYVLYIIYFSLSYVNTVYDRYQKSLTVFRYTMFFRLNWSGITYYLCILRAPVINSEIIQASQTQTYVLIGKQRDIHNGIVNSSGLYRLKRTNNSICVLASHKLIPISRSHNKLIRPTFYYAILESGSYHI